MSGVNTTLVLHPTATELSDITFDMAVESGATSGYVVPAQTIELREGERWSVTYSEGAMMDGGRVANAQGPLVEITFDVRVADTTRAGMIAKANALEQVVTHADGGTLEFKPDGLGVGVYSTFFHYLQSRPPELKAVRGNRWDAPSNRDGVYRVVLTVRLMTMPLATSDPGSPVQLLSSVTLDNTDDGTRDNYTTISGGNIPGNWPALIRIRANPRNGSSEALSRLIVGQRTRGLANFQSVYNTATYLSPTGAWSSQSDSSRSGGSYYRCTPASTGTTYGLRYTISNWDDHQGRAAIVLSGRDNSTAQEAIEVWATLNMANTQISGEIKTMPAVGEWRLLVLAEFDIPETEVSDVEDLDLYIDVYFKRVSGSGTFDVDCINLMYTDEGIVEAVATPTGVAAGTTHDVLIENFVEELAHVINNSDAKLQYIMNLIGTPGLIGLKPGQDNRLDFLWERAGGPAAFSDDFSGYSSKWQKISSMESGETWTFSAGSSTGVKTDRVTEGSQSVGGDGGAGGHVTAYRDVALDLSGISDDDFICVGLYGSTSGVTTVTVKFHTVADTDYFSGTHVLAPIGGTYMRFQVKKSAFATTGAPSWANIARIEIDAVNTTARYNTFDDFRVSAVDPDNTAVPNDTGDVWDFPLGKWNVEELDGTPKSLGVSGYILNSQSLRMAVIYESYGADVRLSARVQARTSGASPNHYAGLVFRVVDETNYSEDCYFFCICPSTNQAILYEYNNGSDSSLASAAFSCSLDTWYYLGVIAEGSSLQCFASLTEADLFDEGNRLIDTTDSTHASGKCGVAVRNCAGRFQNVALASVSDRHLPADQLDVDLWAIFRTLYPFAE